MNGYEIIATIGILILLANFIYLMWQLAKNTSRL
jgi:hypothetical protein